MGREGFYWWQGVVEDRNDPLKAGRCRVRILGIHTNNKGKNGIPTEDLPWAMPVIPLNSEEQITPPKEGTWVMGFFRDSENCQDPVMLGTLPGISEEPSPNSYTTSKTEQVGFFDPAGTLLNSRPINIEDGFEVVRVLGSANSSRKTQVEQQIKTTNTYPKHIGEPDTSRFSRNDAEFDPKTSTVLKWKIDNKEADVSTGRVGVSWSEPNPEAVFNATYPYNKANVSESGHVFEIDDTQNAERIHIFHRSGTFNEKQPSGDEVNKVVGNKYDITVLDSNQIVYNNNNTTVGGNKSTKTLGDNDNYTRGTYNVRSTGDNYTSTNASMYVKAEAPIYMDGGPMVYINCGKSKHSPTTTNG